MVQQMIPPGSVLGILGGGQLGRMTALAAANLGYRTHIFAPEKDSPASDVAWRFTCADYNDQPALEAFAANVDSITVEFENVPEAALTLLAELKPARPNARALATAQDRLVEKNIWKVLVLRLHLSKLLTGQKIY